MSNVSSVAEYIYFKNSTLPSSTAEMFEGRAAREIRGVLGFVNSSTNELLKDLEEEGLMMTGNLANLTSADHLIGNAAEDGATFPKAAVDFIVDSVAENVSRAINILSEEETSTEIFGYTSEEMNDTFFGNLTAINSTLSEHPKHSNFSRDLLFFGATVFVCGVLLFAQLMHIMHKSSSDKSEEVYSPSQVVAKYRARYPKIDEEDEENAIELGTSVADSNPVGEQAGGEIRKTEALVPYTLPNPKKHRNYTSLPIAWDFDGKIIAQIGDEHMVTNDVVKDSETQTAPEETVNVMTSEQLDQLKEECKDFEFIDD